MKQKGTTTAAAAEKKAKETQHITHHTLVIYTKIVAKYIIIF